MESYDDNKIIITNDDGEQVECEILFTYEHKETGKNYVVLYPVSQAEDDSVEDDYSEEESDELFEDVSEDSDDELLRDDIDDEEDY